MSEEREKILEGRIITLKNLLFRCLDHPYDLDQRECMLIKQLRYDQGQK